MPDEEREGQRVAKQAVVFQETEMESNLGNCKKMKTSDGLVSETCSAQHIQTHIHTHDNTHTQHGEVVRRSREIGNSVGQRVVETQC